MLDPEVKEQLGPGLKCCRRSVDSFTHVAGKNWFSINSG